MFVIKVECGVGESAEKWGQYVGVKFSPSMG